MTREEELDWLCRLRSEIYVYMPKEWLIPMNEALDMAIKALKQYGALQEIRNDLSEYNIYDHEQVFTDYYDAFNTGIHTALIIIDKHIKEIEE